MDFANIRGLENIKRAVMLCLAGGHNLLIVGRPGYGKSMLLIALAKANALYNDGHLVDFRDDAEVSYYQDHVGHLIATMNHKAYFDLLMQPQSKHKLRQVFNAVIELPNDYMPGVFKAEPTLELVKKYPRRIRSHFSLDDPDYRLSEACANLLVVASERLGLNPAQQVAAQAMARTIADVAGHETIRIEDIAEGIQYRSEVNFLAYVDVNTTLMAKTITKALNGVVWDFGTSVVYKLNEAIQLHIPDSEVVGMRVEDGIAQIEILWPTIDRAEISYQRVFDRIQVPADKVSIANAIVASWIKALEVINLFNVRYA